MSEMQSVIQSLGALPYGGIFVLFTVINALIPFPEELLIIGLGYLGQMGAINIFIATPLAILGLIISDVIIFSLIKSGNKYIIRLSNKLFGNFDENQEFVDKHIRKIIFFSRFVFGFRFIGLFTAGFKKVSFRTFIFYELSAIIILVLSLVFIGVYFQSRFEKIFAGIETIRHIGFLAITTILILFLGRIIRRKILKFMIITKNNNKNNKIDENK